MNSQSRYFHFDCEDRLSTLPEDILHDIVSFLDMSNVVQTSFLSRRWRYLWLSSPTLFFIINNLHFNKQVKLLKGVLNRHSDIKINKVRLSFEKFSNDLSRIYPLIHMVVSHCNVGHVDVEISCSSGFHYSSGMFVSESLRKLVLKQAGYCPKLPHIVYLPNLETLSLDVSLMRSEVINNLLWSCPSLKNLHLRFFTRWNRLNIASEHIKSLSIDYYGDCNKRQGEKIVIYAPNMCYFQWKGPLVEYYIISDLKSLSSAYISIQVCQVQKWTAHSLIKLFSSLYHAASISIDTVGIKYDSVDYYSFLRGFCDSSGFIKGLPSSLWYTTYLKISTSLSKAELPVLTCLLKSVPNLRTLVLVKKVSCTNEEECNIDGEEHWDTQNLDSSSILNQLEVFRSDEFEGSGYATKLLKYLVRRASVLKKIVIVPAKVATEVNVCD